MPGIRGGPWCHFNFRPRGAPDWLQKFSRDVRLPKERGSLSFLLLVRGQDVPVRIAPLPVPTGHEVLVRAISEPFDLPDYHRGRYGCCGRGLVLLRAGSRSESSRNIEPGDLVVASWPEKTVRDHKSKAWILPLGRSGK